MPSRRAHLAGLTLHLFIAVPVCAFLTAFWALTSGSIAEVGRIARNPSLATKLGFWPIWVILAWATLLTMHTGLVLARFAMGRHRRRAAASALAQLGARTHHRVTVMFVDAVDSTTHNESLGDEQWSDVLTRYRAISRKSIHAHQGLEVNTAGDGLLAAFDLSPNAVRGAIDLQQRLAAARDAGKIPFHVRIGIHTGEAVEEEGDLVGQVLNVAARVTAAAAPGEIFITEPVADALTGTGIALDDRGLQELRGVGQPRHLLAVPWEPVHSSPSTD